MSVMAMAAHTGCNTVYGSTAPNNPHPYPWMNSLFQDGVTVGWLMGESFIVDHARRSVIPERLADILLTRDAGAKPTELPPMAGQFRRHRRRGVLPPHHFTDALMTDQEIVELPKVWVVGGDGGMGDIGYQNMSKVMLQNRPNVKVLMLDTQVYSNTGGQNSDSTPMLGGGDMNTFGAATQGKNTEKKTVAETFLAGHGSPFVAQVSMANAPKLYRAILDGLEYRGTMFLQAFTTCQPEHGVADDMALIQAQRVRDSRGVPEFVFNPRLGETYQEALDLKGNPSIDLDWYETKNKVTGEPRATPSPTGAPPKPASATTSRRSSPKPRPSSSRSITCWSASRSRTWSTAAISTPPPRLHPRLRRLHHQSRSRQNDLPRLSRQLVMFCVERRKAWRMLQSKAGIVNKEYAAQRDLLAEVDAGKLPLEENQSMRWLPSRSIPGLMCFSTMALKSSVVAACSR
jgi:pyruvate-ferredoxin/flavodoxin oxidoreductase